MKNKYTFIYFSIGILVFIKIILSAYFYNFSLLAPDEEHNYRLALQYIQTGSYPMEAFYGSGSFFLYTFLIKYGIDKEYYILFYFILTHILYGLSIFWFYKLARYFLPEKQSVITSYIYALYPSVLFYVGAIFNYENLTTYLLIFNIYILIRLFNGEKTNILNLILVVVFATVSCLLRGQMLAIYALLFCVLLFIAFLHILKYKATAQIYLFFVVSFLLLTCICITHYPILKKNEKIFNVKILSTQFGFELLQGHNPHARGSWMGGWYVKGNVFYEYAHKNIPDIESLNQYEESVKRKELAIEWIKNNPIDELVLTIRKTAIYFLPVNYEVLPYSDRYNPITLLVHLLFICFILRLIWHWKYIDVKTCIILLPVAGSYIISIIFFTGSRWRFYADPFMILMASIFLFAVLANVKHKKSSTQ